MTATITTTPIAVRIVNLAFMTVLPVGLSELVVPTLSLSGRIAKVLQGFSRPYVEIPFCRQIGPAESAQPFADL
jgi:hypothetical protein